MNYYIFIVNNEAVSCGQAKRLGDDVINYEVDEIFYNEFFENPNKYIWDGSAVVIDTEYEAKQAQAERERIAKLYLTGADVERGIYQAKGMDFDDIVAMVTQLQPEGLDIKALKIELKANHFYRGNPYVSAIGGLLGFTIGQLDKFFEFNDYTYLISEPDVDNAEEPVEENPVITETETDEV